MHIGNRNKEYKSPLKKLCRHLEDSRDQWKEKAMNAKAELKNEKKKFEYTKKKLKLLKKQKVMLEKQLQQVQLSPNDFKKKSSNQE